STTSTKRCNSATRSTASASATVSVIPGCMTEWPCEVRHVKTPIEQRWAGERPSQRGRPAGPVQRCSAAHHHPRRDGRRHRNGALHVAAGRSYEDCSRLWPDWSLNTDVRPRNRKHLTKTQAAESLRDHHKTLVDINSV